MGLLVTPPLSLSFPLCGVGRVDGRVLGGWGGEAVGVYPGVSHQGTLCSPLLPSRGDPRALSTPPCAGSPGGAHISV